MLHLLGAIKEYPSHLANRELTHQGIINAYLTA